MSASLDSSVFAEGKHWHTHSNVSLQYEGAALFTDLWYRCSSDSKKKRQPVCCKYGEGGWLSSTREQQKARMARQLAPEEGLQAPCFAHSISINRVFVSHRNLRAGVLSSRSTCPADITHQKAAPGLGRWAAPSPLPSQHLQQKQNPSPSLGCLSRPTQQVRPQAHCQYRSSSFHPCQGALDLPSLHTSPSKQPLKH